MSEQTAPQTLRERAERLLQQRFWCCTCDSGLTSELATRDHTRQGHGVLAIPEALRRQVAAALVASEQELADITASRERIHASFGNAVPVAGKCQCPYCRRDLDDLAELAASYEMDLHTTKAKLAAREQEIAKLQTASLEKTSSDAVRAPSVPNGEDSGQHLSIGGWAEPQTLVLRVYNINRRIETELPASPLATDIQVLLSNLGQEVARWRGRYMDIVKAESSGDYHDQLTAAHTISSLHDKLDADEALVKEREQEIATLKAERGRLHSLVSWAQAYLDPETHAELDTAITSELHTCEDTIASLSGRIEHENARADAAEAQLLTFEHRVYAAELQAAGAKARIEQLEARLTAQAAHLRGWVTTWRALAEKYTDAGRAQEAYVWSECANQLDALLTGGPDGS
jgi:hypothetical protein